MTDILRIFPRRTNTTPVDDMVLIGHKPLFVPECDEVHVSVTFSWDIQDAEDIAHEYRASGYNVRIGGPAYDDPGDEFVPGRYVDHGYVITSRGCPNKCWFCSTWKREGGIRELPITEGYNVLDSNLLACSEKHISAVFAMLSQQKERAIFSGGLDPALITQDIADELRRIKTDRLYTAYDTPDDYESILQAGIYLKKAGFGKRHNMLCYVLIGYKGDTFDAANDRLTDTLKAGFTPMAMLYRRDDEPYDIQWRRFQRPWARPASIHGRNN